MAQPQIIEDASFEDIGISFVVTVYNKAPFLAETFAFLRGIAAEIPLPAEFIFVDDGSTDQSADLLAGFAAQDERVRVLSQSNSGPAVALNAGVRAARFTLVKPLDADDSLVEGALPLLKRILEEHQADLVISDARDSMPSYVVVEDRPVAKVIRESWADCTSALFLRSAFLAVGGCDERLFVQDYSYIRRMACRGRIARVKHHLSIQPDAGQDSVGKMRAQVQHDNNGANYGLVLDFPDLPRRIKRLAFHVSASRAWKWDRRHNKARFGLCASFWIWLLSYLPVVPCYHRLFRATLTPFRRSDPIRFHG